MFTLIAEMDDLGPYVPSINNHGTVAFWTPAGIFAGDGGAPRCLMGGDFCSHPDIDDELACCVYGAGRVLHRRHGEKVEWEYARVGPLGPTMNQRGAVAFRADEALFLNGRLFASSGFRAFHGLPVVNAAGTVVFRADRADGTSGIYTSLGETIVETCGKLGLFPDLNDEGTIVFATESGIFSSHQGQLVGGFESYRGALINNAGQVFFCATPQGGQLGLYSLSRRLLALGDNFLGNQVREFALNSVSLNDCGQLAVRVGLENGRHLIVRMEI